MTITRPQIRQKIKDSGFPRAEIAEVADQLEAEFDAECDYDYRIRRATCERYVPIEKHSKMLESVIKRFGQPSGNRFRHAFVGGGDWTEIPNWDVVAEDVAREFFELNKNNRPAEELYRIITTPIAERPARIEFLSRAIDVMTANQTETSDVPF